MCAHVRACARIRVCVCACACVRACTGPVEFVLARCRSGACARACMSKGPFARAVRLSTRWGSTIATVVRHIPLPCLFSSSFSLSSGAAGRRPRGFRRDSYLFFGRGHPKTVKEVREGGWKREWLAMRLFPGLSARFGLGILEARAECPREAFLHRLVEESLCQYLGGQSACAWAGSER